MMSLPKDISELKFLRDWCILLGYRGSISHGTYKSNKDPNSIDDKDVMGICIPPFDYYYGLNTHTIHKGTKEIKEGEWSLEKVKDEAERLFASSEIAYIQSNLPVKPDHEKINKLCVDIAKCWCKENES